MSELVGLFAICRFLLVINVCELMGIEGDDDICLLELAEESESEVLIKSEIGNGDCVVNHYLHGDQLVRCEDLEVLRDDEVKEIRKIEDDREWWGYKKSVHSLSLKDG